MTRLTSEFWVQAYLRRLRLQDIAAFVTSHGDDSAGAILVKLNTLDGQAKVFMRGFDIETGARKWETFVDGPEEDADSWIARQREFDVDVWVIEVEDRGGRHLLDEDGLAE